MPDEICRISNLTLSRAEKVVSGEYVTAWEWYMAHEGQLAPMPYGDNQPKGIELRMAAQRGIHKPKGHDHVLMIHTSNPKSGISYNDDDVVDQGDGTWLLRYSEHVSRGKATGPSPWNEALRKNMRDGVPVGVFVWDSGGKYWNRGLAFVESYDSSSGMFTLHGPVTKEDSDRFISIVNPSDLSNEEKRALDKFDSEEDERERRLVEGVIRRGQQRFRKCLVDAYGGACAVTACDVDSALQAAHISGYRGAKSQIASNGLLLRADLHQMFDRYIWSVDPGSLKIELAPSLAGTAYERLHGRKLKLPNRKTDRPDPVRLHAHYEMFKHALPD